MAGGSAGGWITGERLGERMGGAGEQTAVGRAGRRTASAAGSTLNILCCWNPAP